MQCPQEKNIGQCVSNAERLVPGAALMLYLRNGPRSANAMPQEYGLGQWKYASKWGLGQCKCCASKSNGPRQCTWCA